MMRIIYLTRINFDSLKANVYTTTKTCEALAQVPGVELTLVSTHGDFHNGGARRAFFSRHDVAHPFRIEPLAVWAGRVDERRSRWHYRFSVILAQFALCRYVWRHRREFDVVYARDHLIPLPLLFAHALGKPFFFEAHFVLSKRAGQWLTEFLIRRAQGVIAITQGLAAYYRKCNSQIVVAYCAAANPGQYSQIQESKLELRRRLELPPDAVFLGYTGNMNVTGNGDSYGIEDIIRALPLLPKNVLFLGIGKKPGEKLPAEALAQKLGVADQALFLPWVPRSDLPAYRLASDILIVPSSGAQLGNSPTKLFEYLPSGRPIIAADTPPIKEVLRNGENALLVDYRKPEVWRDAIMRLIADSGLKNRLSAQALQDATEYSWEKRAQTIDEFVRGTL